MTDSGNLSSPSFPSSPFFFSIKYHNIRGLFTHQGKIYCNDINGCLDNGGRVDDNILLRLLEQEIAALLRIRAARTHKKGGENTTFLKKIFNKLHLFCGFHCATHTHTHTD